jgi:CheY-like chemotaxis protein
MNRKRLNMRPVRFRIILGMLAFAMIQAGCQKVFDIKPETTLDSENAYQNVFDADAAQREVDSVLPDVILLDWMLPGESGVSLAKRWRQQ